MNPILRCSARLHALDTARNDYFALVGPDGRPLIERMEDTGYFPAIYAEHIGQGYYRVSSLVDGWMKHGDTCASIVNPDFEHSGIGLYIEEGSDGGVATTTSSMWTKDLAPPR